MKVSDNEKISVADVTHIKLSIINITQYSVIFCYSPIPLLLITFNTYTFNTVVDLEVKMKLEENVSKNR